MKLKELVSRLNVLEVKGDLERNIMVCKSILAKLGRVISSSPCEERWLMDTIILARHWNWVLWLCCVRRFLLR